MSFIEEIKERARQDIKKIVMPETSDRRTLIAAGQIIREGIADVIMVGKYKKIMEGAHWLDLDLSKVTVVDPEHFEDEIIVCECARVSLGTIKEVIKLNDLTTVEEITQYTKAGAFCKSCIKPGGHEKREYYLVDILAEVRSEMESERLKAIADARISGSGIDSDLSFEELSVVKQLKAVEAIIDEHVRPMLEMDGGNMEILDIKSEDGRIDIYIRYLGACSGCASGTTGTLYAIESILQENLSPNIRVIPV